MKKKHSPFLLFSAITFSVSVAQGATWFGGTGNYGTAGNWSPSGIPAAATAVVINAGNATNTGNLNRAGSTNISGSGVLTITNGRLINAVGGPAAITVSGTGGITQTGNYFLVSNNNVGSITQTGGTVSSTVDRGWFMSDGAGSAGTYTLSGGALNVSTSGSNTTNSAYSVHVGKNSSSDLFLINGGNATFTATVADVRTYISKGARMQIDSGSAAYNGFRFFIVGRDNAVGTTSELEVNGGSLSVSGLPSNGAFVVGNGNAGEVTFNAGTIDISGSAMWLGDNSAGTFIQNGGELTINSEIVLSRALNSTGLYRMTGGVLTATGIIIGAGVNPLFDFQGGDIYLTGNQTSILGQSWFQDIEGTTAVFDSMANSTHIYVIPEPAATSLALAALAAGLLRRRRP